MKFNLKERHALWIVIGLLLITNVLFYMEAVTSNTYANQVVNKCNASMVLTLTPGPPTQGPIAYTPTPITSTTRFTYVRGGSSGGSSRSSPPPPGPVQQVFSSSLLKQNFSSQSALKSAEDAFKRQQAQQALMNYSKGGGQVKISGLKQVSGTPTRTQSIQPQQPQRIETIESRDIFGNKTTEQVININGAQIRTPENAMSRIAFVGGTIFGGARSIYGPTLTQTIKTGVTNIFKTTPRQAIKGIATGISKRPNLRTGLAFGESLFLPDAYATIFEAATPKTKTTSKQQAVALETIRKNLEKSQQLLSYDEVTNEKTISAKDAYINKTRGELYLSGQSKKEVDAFVKEQVSNNTFVFEDTGLGTRVQKDVTYKPKPGVFGVDTPVGRITPFDILPMATYDLASGGEFTKKLKTNTIKDLQAQGFTKTQAEKEFNRLYFTQVQSRSAGELQGLFQIGVGEELFSSGAIKKSVDVGIKALGGSATKKQAASLVTRKAIAPLFVAGFTGGASSVVVGQRARMQNINPIQVGLGGLTGGVGAAGIGTLIARFGVTRPNVSKLIYAGASTIDPFEPVADIFTSVSRKATGEAELLIPVITPTPSTTITPTPSSSKTPSVVSNPNVVYTPNTSVTPTNVLTITPTTTINPSPTPSPNVSPVPEFVYSPNPSPTPDPTFVVTPTPEPVITPTPTLTPTATITPTATFVPTFTAPFPFVPPVFDFSGAGSGRGKARINKRYFNELSSAKGLLMGFDTFTGYTAKNVFPPKKTRTTKPKKQKKNTFEDLTQQQFSGFKQKTGYDFSNFIFKPRTTTKRRKK